MIATGSIPRIPNDIPGIDLPHVVQGWDVMQGKVSTGDRVAVIGFARLVAVGFPRAPPPLSIARRLGPGSHPLRGRNPIHGPGLHPSEPSLAYGSLRAASPLA